MKATRTERVDDWSRPIAIDEAGNIYVDVNCGQGKEDWHTTTPDYGEPCSPIQLEFENE